MNTAVEAATLMERYWSLPDEVEPLEGQAASKELLELFEDCVRKRLVADVPLGAFLSGGIDSSSVVGIMRKHKSEGLKTFSVDFEASESADQVNETRWSNMVSE